MFYNECNWPFVTNIVKLLFVLYVTYVRFEVVFTFIFMTFQVELEDETRRLCDVRPFSPLLRLIESPKHTSQQNRTEKIINAQISILMGKGMTFFTKLNYFSFLNQEVSI